MCLDGATVSVVRLKPAKFHRRNYIRIAHASRELMAGSREVYVWCERGYDLEKWLVGLSRGARISQDAEAREVQRQLDAFSRIAPACMAIKEKGGQDALAALNAVVHRIWWCSHRSEVLLAMARAKLDKKLARLKKPSVVTELHTGSITVGPNLPIATAAQLVAITAGGAVTVDAEVEYAGGL
jgi:hypothetical protein